MNRLSDDVIVSIFLTLPVSRSVCKSWHAIINGSYFIDLHHNRPSNKDRLLSYRNCQDLTLLSYRNERFVANERLVCFPRNAAHHVEPVGSVRGILCFTSETSIYFSNPSTCKFKTVRNPYTHYLLHDRPKYGFGFVPRTRDFKLVRMLSKSGSHHKNNSHQVNIYTSSSDSWRRVGNRFSCVVRGSGSEATLDEIVHWRASSLTRLNVKYNFILAFDIDKEEFRRINLPGSCSPNVDYGIFTSGCGRFLHMYSVAPYMTFNIWVMSEYGVSSSWTKLFTVEDNLFLINSFMFVQCDDRLLAVTFGGSIIVYDRTGREANRHISVLKYHQWGVPVLTYKESLVWFDESKFVEKNMFGIKGVDYSGWLMMISIVVLVVSCFLMFVPIWFLNFWID